MFHDYQFNRMVNKNRGDLPRLYLFERLRNRYRRNRALLFERKLHKLKPANPYISFTFDDFPQSAYLIGGTILKKYGIRGTYYTSLGLMGKESPVGRIFSLKELRDLVTDGHELGCHTYDHLDAWETNLDSFEKSILRNREALKSILPQVYFATFSYPREEPHPMIKRIAGTYFVCCRGGGQTLNSGMIDLNLAKSCFIDSVNGETLSSLKILINKNKVEKGWLIFSTHDICMNPSRFGCGPDYFEDIVRYAANSGAVILPVCEVYSQIYGDKQ